MTSDEEKERTREDASDRRDKIIRACRDIVSKLISSKGFEMEMYVPECEILVTLRASRSTWTTDGIERHETIDVVRIGWLPFLYGERGISEKPKRSAGPLWDSLEAVCEERGMKVRVECVHERKIVEYLARERGYRMQHTSLDCLIGPHGREEGMDRDQCS